MNCPFCGSPLTLKDEKCPHCGMENPDVLKHRSDMRHYKKTFEKTQKDVYTTTRRFTHLSIRAFIIAILIILNLLAIIFVFDNWYIATSINMKRIANNIDLHIKNVDTYISDGNYLDIGEYYRNYGLSLSDEFRPYQDIITTSQKYSRILQDINYLLSPSYSEWYSENLASSLTYYFETISYSSYLSEKYCKEEHLEAIEDIDTRIYLLLKSFCNFTDDDWKTLPELSESAIKKLIEERMELHETETS